MCFLPGSELDPYWNKTRIREKRIRIREKRIRIRNTAVKIPLPCLSSPNRFLYLNIFLLLIDNS